MPDQPCSPLVAVLGTAVFLGACQSAPVVSAARSGPLVHASADDCAIIVAIGKSELKWGRTAPSAAFLTDFALPEGATYREDCPWRKLGVAEPATSDGGSAAAFSITRPLYAGDHATAWFQYSVAAVHAPSGEAIPPFLEREQCAVRKDGAGWHLLDCRLSEIR